MEPCRRAAAKSHVDHQPRELQALRTIKSLRSRSRGTSLHRNRCRDTGHSCLCSPWGLPPSLRGRCWGFRSPHSNLVPKPGSALGKGPGPRLISPSTACKRGKTLVFADCRHRAVYLFTPTQIHCAHVTHMPCQDRCVCVTGTAWPSSY